MNRSGAGPQPLRAMSNSFPNQQQAPSNRTSSGRPPNGKMTTNAATWAFGGVPMGSTGLQSVRSGNGPLSSFAQTIGSSQPSTPLDPSDFPSLSNNQPLPSSNSSQSMWAMPGVARHASQSTAQRPQQPLLSTQQQVQSHQQSRHQPQQDDMFSPTSHMTSTPNAFRYSGQDTVSHSSQAQSNPIDEFPPLNRNANGEVNHDRQMGLLQNVGFGGQTSGPSYTGHASASLGSRNNGLLNALSTGNRAQPATPGVISTNSGINSNSQSPVESNRLNATNIDMESNGYSRSTQQLLNTSREHMAPANFQSQNNNSLVSASDLRPPSTQHVDSVIDTAQRDPGDSDDTGLGVSDPLSGMNDLDRFGLKGLLGLVKGPYADQASLITGMDITDIGLADLSSPERVSDMIWDPFDDTTPKPIIPKYVQPDCYQVHNIQPIENKLGNFSEETLIAMFYLNPGDIQQFIAAQELHHRNWRWHKKLKIWLTKDDMMIPQPLTGGLAERGYYVFFDTKTWTRERRELLLTYTDLEQLPAGPVS